MTAMRGIGYIGLTVPNVDEWAAYATSVIGLMPARSLPGENPFDPPSAGTGRSAAGTFYLKADEHQWSVALHGGEHPGISYVGFEMSSQRAFEEATEQLVSEGYAPVRGSADDLAARGVRDLVHVYDPVGVRVELFWGPVLDGGFNSPVGVPRFVTGALGLGHYVLLTPELEPVMRFYQRGLGMALTDYSDFGAGMSGQFLRCGPRHHTVALISVGPATGVHHVALEVPDIDQVGYALARARRASVPITASLGRHKNDRMLSFYMRSPAGFEVEVGCGGLLIDEDTWVTNHFTGGDEWGHEGLTADVMAQPVEPQGAVV